MAKTTRKEVKKNMTTKPEIRERIYSVRIEGTAPLLMHSPEGLAAPKPKTKGIIPSPEDESEACLYRDGKGGIVVPARCVEGSIVKAAGSKSAPGQGKKTYKQFILAGVQVGPEEIPLISAPYKIDARRAVIGRAGIIRCRPRFDEWALEFELRVIDAYLLGSGQDAQLRSIFEDAGALVGLLDFRPRFGRYKVSKFEFKSEA